MIHAGRPRQRVANTLSGESDAEGWRKLAAPMSVDRRHRGRMHHLAAISATVMSSMRLEKPHSLSYQLSTLTRVPPITRVWVAS